MYNNTDFTYWRRARPIPIFAISPPEPVVREWRLNHKQRWRRRYRWNNVLNRMYWTTSVGIEHNHWTNNCTQIIVQQCIWTQCIEHKCIEHSVLNTIIERQAKNEKQGKHQNKSVKPPSKQDAKDNHFHPKKTILRTFTLENLLSWKSSLLRKPYLPMCR